MRLGDLITAETKINEEILIGKELEILEGETLLLAIQKGEFFVESEEKVCPATRILALYEAPEDEEEDDWDEEEWDDEEFDFDFEEEREIITNRQAILNSKDEYEPELLDVCEIIINGDVYTVYEAEESFMDEHPHDAVQALKRADEAGVVSQKWQDKALEELALVEYIVEDSMMDVAWNADILSIDFNFSEDDDENEVLSGKVIECPCGRLDVPIMFNINGPAGEIIPVKVYGTYTLDIWKDAEMLDLDEDELEEICASDQRLLVVEYEVIGADAVLNFYTKDYLDAESRAADELPEIIMGMEDHELRLIDIVDEDFDEEVELELLSYEVFED